MKLSRKQKLNLASVCDSYIKLEESKGSSGESPVLPSELSVVDKIEQLLAGLTFHDQKKFKLLASLVSSPLLGLTYGGPLKPANQLSYQHLQKLLTSWKNSSLFLFRNAFATLKKLTAYYYYAQNNNPNWTRIAYSQESLHVDTKYKPLATQRFEKDSTLACDIVIIGSGPGGSVIASELAKSGKKVVVLEKGKYVLPSQNTQNEEDMIAAQYEMQGLIATARGDMSVLAGATLGGASTINWAGCFRTPGYVLREWAKEHANPHFVTTEYIKGFAKIEKRLGVHEKLHKHNPQNQALWDGAKVLGLEPKLISRNTKVHDALGDAKSWQMEGFSPLGDVKPIKQSASITFLADAIDNGAQVYPETYAKKIIKKSGSACGIEAVSNGLNIAIHADKVVVAAGALNTPVLLQKSGFQHPHIGRNLYLHPTSFVFGKFDQKIEPWYGTMMSTVVDDYSKIEETHYGFKLETPPFHPGILSVIYPWKSPTHFKRLMDHCAYIANFIILVRDKHSGKVVVDRTGRPLIHYKLHKHDKKNLIYGIQKAAAIMGAANAKEVFIAHEDTEFGIPRDPRFNSFIKNISRLKWKPDRFTFGSAHQMGTCRMGGYRKTHPVKPNGELWEMKNLYIADASLFPSASGANPMISVYTLAYYVAQRIKN